MKPDRTIVVIPAYNEEQTIAGLIEELSALYPGIVLVVVNDASKDRTGFLARQTGKATVIDLPQNLGIGGCVQTGFRYACSKDFDYAVQFDGDGQHIPDQIPLLLAFIESGEADVAIGSRFLGTSAGYKSTYVRRMGIRILSGLAFLLTRQHILDCTSGFRAYNRKAVQFLAKNYPTDYPEPEAIILLGKNGFRLKETGVKMQKRQGGKSSISFRRGTSYYMIKVMLGMLMTAVRPKIKNHE